LHLLVEMRKFSACVLEEESAVECERCGKEIRKQHCKEYENRGAVRVDENSLIGNKELELSHEPEGKGEKDSDSQNECIADHVVLPGSLDSFAI
jgi:hypothetical protein